MAIWNGLATLKAKWSAARRNPESRHVVHVDDRAIRIRRPDGNEETVACPEVTRIDIRTSDAGPWGPDVFWVLHGRAGSCTIPRGATSEETLVQRLLDLPGFDHEQMIQAMGCTDDRVFTCWTGSSPQKNTVAKPTD